MTSKPVLLKIYRWRIPWRLGPKSLRCAFDACGAQGHVRLFQTANENQNNYISCLHRYWSIRSEIEISSEALYRKCY